MPSTLSYPGVYVEEIPSGVRTIIGASTSVAAFVGPTQRGPVDEPVRVFNMGDYERTFGAPRRESFLGPCLRQFFANGGNEAWVVRALDGEVAKLVLTRGGGELTLRARDPGNYGNLLWLEIDRDEERPFTRFGLRIGSFSTDPSTGEDVVVELEKHQGLDLHPKSSRFVETILKRDSTLVRAAWKSGTYGAGKLTGAPVTAKIAEFTGKMRVAFRIDSGELRTREIDFTPPPADVNKIGALLQDAIDKPKQDLTVTVGGDSVTLTRKAPGENSSIEFFAAGSADLAKLLNLHTERCVEWRDGTSDLLPNPTGWSWRYSPQTAPTTLKFTLYRTSGSEITVGGAAGVTVPAATDAVSFAQALQAALRAASPELQAVRCDAFAGDIRARLPGTVKPYCLVLDTTGGGSLTDTTREINRFLLGDKPQFQGVNVSTLTASIKSATPGSEVAKPDINTLRGTPGKKSGIYALEKVDQFNILCLPDLVNSEHMNTSEDLARAIYDEALAYCEDRRAFLLIDLPKLPTHDHAQAWMAETANKALQRRNAAGYFPWLAVVDNDGTQYELPPSGAIAGIYARTDTERGIWKAPAGVEALVSGALGPIVKLTDKENGVLNPLGLNCIRALPAYGSVVWGARTLRGGDRYQDEYKYIPIRRLLLYIEESLYRGTHWVVFEPNDEPLWSQIRLNVGQFMHDLFRKGAFQGGTPREAYFVKCDREVNPQSDVDKGIVNIVVGFAPLKPAEFVVLKFQQIANPTVS